MRDATLADEADEWADPLVDVDLLNPYPCCGGVRWEGSDIELLDDDRGARDGFPRDTNVDRGMGIAVRVVEFDEDPDSRPEADVDVDEPSL